ncbi:MAG: GNAT family N-acetyltransferase [Thermoplasmatales archaeon]|nr:GNAT family N-acetyltransferase [Thermoplasmatales archaeon]
MIMFRIADIKFKPLEREDLKLVHELENDFLGTYFSRGMPLTFKSMDEVVNEYEEDIKKGQRRRMVVLYKDDRAGIASIYENPGPMKRAGIGLYLKRDYWNSGIGKVATLGLLEMLFYFLSYERVEAWSASYNRRAHRTLEENGFILEGKLRKSLMFAGVYYDWYIFGLIRDEYMEKRDEILRKILKERYEEYINSMSIFSQ